MKEEAKASDNMIEPIMIYALSWEQVDQGL